MKDKVLIRRIEHLKKSFGGDHEVLHDIDLTIQKGEVIAVVGPCRGCGKSPFLRSLNLLERPTEGDLSKA